MKKLLFVFVALFAVVVAVQNTCLARIEPVHGNAILAIMPATHLMGDTLPPRELFVMEGETLVKMDGVTYASSGCWR